MSMSPQAVHMLTIIGIVVLIVWRMQRRLRRLIGRQPLSPRRPWVTVVAFPVLLGFMALSPHSQPLADAALAGGVVLGIALGIVGLRLTRFEVTPEGLFYTPSAHLGVALSLVLVARLAYRFAVTGFPGSPDAPPPAASLTPLTLFIFGTLAGYYVTYAAGLLRWSLRSRAVPGTSGPSAGSG
jgi:hypothetical protein